MWSAAITSGSQAAPSRGHTVLLPSHPPPSHTQVVVMNLQSVARKGGLNLELNYVWIKINVQFFVLVGTCSNGTSTITWHNLFTQDRCTTWLDFLSYEGTNFTHMPYPYTISSPRVLFGGLEALLCLAEALHPNNGTSTITWDFKEGLIHPGQVYYKVRTFRPMR